MHLQQTGQGILCHNTAQGPGPWLEIQYWQQTSFILQVAKRFSKFNRQQCSGQADTWLFGRGELRPGRCGPIEGQAQQQSQVADVHRALSVSWAVKSACRSSLLALTSQPWKNDIGSILFPGRCRRNFFDSCFPSFQGNFRFLLFNLFLLILFHLFQYWNKLLQLLLWFRDPILNHQEPLT